MPQFPLANECDNDTHESGAARSPGKLGMNTELARREPAVQAAHSDISTHEQAARAILAELTLDEKLALLHQAAPAIDRLGLAAFRTGTEGLHGLSWLGTATTFPQPIGLAATWDQDLLTRAGDVVATEVRAKHAQDPTVSLNVWAPVVNSLRHPLWGRNEEGYSEDPLLTGDCAIAYSQGLKGLKGSAFWKTVPTLKHFLAYNNEVDRAVTSSDLSARVLHEYEFPAFSRPLAANVIGAVMPSYNLVNGRPNHLAKDLLDTLRSWSAQPISVVSDAGAPQNVITLERYYTNPADSHAAMLTAGIDSFTDNDNNSEPTISAVKAALDKELITLADVEQAVFRLLYLRSLTGEFVANPLVASIYNSATTTQVHASSTPQPTADDSSAPAEELVEHQSEPASDPYADIPSDAIDTAEHRVLALEAAEKGIVLLKNEQTLPLNQSHQTIAVVGPLANRTLHDWYSGTPPYLSTVGEGLTSRFPDRTVAVDDGADHIAIYSPASKRYLALTEEGAVVAHAETLSAAETFSVTDWGHGVSTLRAHSNDLLLQGGWLVNATATRVGGWVAQETFMLHAHEDGTCSIKHVGSGKWLRTQNGSGLVSCDSTDLSQAERFEIDVRSSGTARVAALAAQSDVSILVAGNDPHILGRETEDRPDLDLPRVARALWRAIAASPSQKVLAVVSSYPYALRDIKEEADAIVWSSHGGQELGNAFAAVLAGDKEPFGRLAQEWVNDESCLPHILDYDIIGSGGTYWYNDCEPDFEFGFGLSYTSVTYDSLELLSAADIADESGAAGAAGAAEGESAELKSAESDEISCRSHDAPARARVTVSNTGERAVNELVAVYTALEFSATPLNSPAPLRRLAGYTRVYLAPGQSATVEFDLYPEAFRMWDVREERLKVQPGTYSVWVGTSRSQNIRAEWEVDAKEFAAPFELLGARLRADQFDEHNYIVHSDADKTGANCVTAAHGHPEGYIEFHNVDPLNVSAIKLELARNVAGRSGEARVEFLEPSDSAGYPRTLPAGHIATELPHDRYEWTSHEVPFTHMLNHDSVQSYSTMRVTLRGNVRLRSIQFV